MAKIKVAVLKQHRVQQLSALFDVGYIHKGACIKQCNPMWIYLISKGLDRTSLHYKAILYICQVIHFLFQIINDVSC